MLLNKTIYNTTVLVSGDSTGVIFDDTCNVYLEDSNYGKAYIIYNDAIRSISRISRKIF